MYSKVLTVEEQKFNPDEYGMPGFEYRHIRGPLARSNLVGSIDSFYFGDYSNPDAILSNYCLRRRPQVVLMTVQFLKKPGNLPSVGTVQCIRDLGIPVVLFWFDIHADVIGDLLERYCHAATLNVLFGSSPNSHKASSLQKTNYVYAGLTFEEPQFNLPNRNRDVPVSFLGSLFPERVAYIEGLRSRGISVYTDGGILVNGVRSKVMTDRVTPIWKPYSVYLELLSRTQITLNFTSLPTSKIQVRGRVWEALWCKTFLLEEDNPVTPLYFAPNEDYVPFTDLDDLVDKVKYYIAHDSERDRIRLHGRATVEKYYNARLFWGNLLSTVEALVRGAKCSGELWNIQYYKDHGVV